MQIHLAVLNMKHMTDGGNMKYIFIGKLNGRDQLINTYVHGKTIQRWILKISGEKMGAENQPA
jgi:hypothetical protein